MTSDLPTRVREAFYVNGGAALLDAALAAVIAVVQEDRTREIVGRVRHSADAIDADDVSRTARTLNRIALVIESEFGGTTYGD